MIQLIIDCQYQALTEHKNILVDNLNADSKKLINK